MIKLGRFFELYFDEDKKELVIQDKGGNRYAVGLKVKWLGRYTLITTPDEKVKLEKIYEEKD